jgi:hypothetical protein
MKKLILLALLASTQAFSDVKSTPIYRLDISDVTVISERINKDKWRVTFTNHDMDNTKCAVVNWRLDGFYWHPLCSNDATYSSKKFIGFDDMGKKLYRSEKMRISGQRFIPTNKVNVIGYLKKTSNDEGQAAIKGLGVVECGT